MRRIAPLLATALSLALSPLPAPALTAVFDFDDFPYVDYSDYIDDLNPYTSLYGCEGKDHCTGRDIARANHVTAGEGNTRTISTTRNGIFMELGRSEMLVNYEQGGDIIHGNDGYDYDLFLLDFDTPLRSFSAKFDRPGMVDRECDDDDQNCTDINELLKLYLWSEPGGQGELVGSLTIAPDPLLPSYLTVALVSDAPFRSANIGKAISTDPDCITDADGCGVDAANGDFGYGGPSFVLDDIVVSTVPEPSTALLIGLGLLALANRSAIRCAN
jgi:hypothetical protein